MNQSASPSSRQASPQIITGTEPVSTHAGGLKLLTRLPVDRMFISWAFRKRVHNFLRSSLWVVPAFSTLAAFLSIPLLRALERRLGFQFLRYSPDGARALATIVSSAMLSFVVLFFSVLLLTVQIASSAAAAAF